MFVNIMVGVICVVAILGFCYSIYCEYRKDDIRDNDGVTKRSEKTDTK